MVKLVGLIKMCSYETYSTVRVGKYLSDTFNVKNRLIKGDGFRLRFFCVTSEYYMPLGSSSKPLDVKIECHMSDYFLHQWS